MTLPVNPWPDDDVILYDGVCVFCSRWIRFIATSRGIGIGYSGSLRSVSCRMRR